MAETQRKGVNEFGDAFDGLEATVLDEGVSDGAGLEEEEAEIGASAINEELFKSSDALVLVYYNDGRFSSSSFRGHPNFYLRTHSILQQQA
jgi:hypothetical protein